MKDIRKEIGICDDSFELLTVRELIERGIIERPIDGNHGEIHPKTSDFVPDGVPFVMASDLKHGRVNYSSCARITEKQAEGLRKGFAKNGDVLLTHKATIGETAIVAYDDHPYVMLTPQVTYYRIRDHKTLSNRYLKYYFDSSLFQQTLRMMAGSGSTRAYLGILEQQRLPIIRPPIEKQEKIVAILGGLDDLISNNRLRITLLEKIAEEVYREWFVRMRFPGYANAKFTKGLPEGWLTKPSNEVFDVLSGGTPKTEVAIFWDGDIPFFTPKDAGENFYALTTEKNITEKGLESCNSPLYPKDTIFITARGTVGKLALAYYPMAMNQSCYALAPKMEGPVCFHFLAMRNAIMYVKGVSKSGVFDNIVIDTFKSVPIITPDDNVIKLFNGLMKPLFDQIGTLMESNNRLIATRDALLPRLISGKLSVEALDIRF